MASSLGAFTFRLWVGPPPGAIRQAIQVLEHPGVDYEAYRFLGLRSGTYTRRSRVDTATLAAARTAYATYVAAIQTGPHQIVWNDFDFDTESVRAVVQDVQLIYIRNNLVIAGATTPGNTWDMECEWRFRLTPI